MNRAASICLAEDGQTGAPEDDDDDPFRELHPDLDDAPAAPEIPADNRMAVKALFSGPPALWFPLWPSFL